MDLSLIIGKTIASARQYKHRNHDDEGWLHITFTDGTQIVIIAGYGGYTGQSEDEYPTLLQFAHPSEINMDVLVPLNDESGVT